MPIPVLMTGTMIGLRIEHLKKLTFGVCDLRGGMPVGLATRVDNPKVLPTSVHPIQYGSAIVKVKAFQFQYWKAIFQGFPKK
jgi:hypothetical protein